MDESSLPGPRELGDWSDDHPLGVENGRGAKSNQESDRRFSSAFPFTRAHFGVTLFLTHSQMTVGRGPPD